MMKKTMLAILFLLLIPGPALAQEGICGPLDLRCEGKTVQQCNTLGSQWVDIENCNISCFNGQCDPELRINWEFLIAGLIALVIIVTTVRILWKKRRLPKPPPVPHEKHLYLNLKLCYYVEHSVQQLLP